MKETFTILSLFFCFYESHGQVGIRTATPKAGLYVADGSVVFSAKATGYVTNSTGFYTTTMSDHANGAGLRPDQRKYLLQSRYGRK